MPLTEYFNALSFMVMRRKEGEDRLKKALQSTKSAEGMIVALLREILLKL